MPMVGSEGPVVDTIRRLAAQDPELPAQLVRQRLADQADTSMTSLVGGEAQGGGARFAKDIAGTVQQATNLDAVLRALPDSPEAPASVDALLEVLRATGKRKPAGLNTAADRETQKALSHPGLFGQGVAAARTAGVSLVRNAAENARRVALGRRMDVLANLFTAPDSANQIADIVARGVEPVLANAARRQALQTPSIAAAFGMSPLGQGSAR
jgi:hypothetical protein